MSPRECIGKNISLVEINTWIAQFFRHFDVDITNDETRFKLNGFWFATQRKFYVRITKRFHH
jgi:hypothetical protein